MARTDRETVRLDVVSDPRFVLTSVTGYGESGGDEATSYQVLDRPYGYALLLETFSRPKAEALAGRLERAHRSEMELRARPKVPIPPGSKMQHGTRSCYQNLRCRCFDCTVATRGKWAAEKRRGRERRG